MSATTLPAAAIPERAHRDEASSAASLAVALQASLLSHPQLNEAAAAWVHGLRLRFHLDRVSVGLVLNGELRAVALSNGLPVAHATPEIERLWRAWSEALDQAASIVFPEPRPQAHPRITLAHSRLRSTPAGAVASVPLVAAGVAIGALCVERDAGLITAAELDTLEHLACLAAPVLNLMRLNQRPLAERLQAITTVAASDVDAATTVVYSISGGADAAAFSINASTGVLSFLLAPNFEAPSDAGANNVYDVIVRASDGTLADTQAIAVTVTTVNEAPEITSNGGATTAAVGVAENQTAVTTVIASDVDAATSLSYTIVGGADAAKFSIDAATGVLRFIAAPDFEAPGDAGANNVYDVLVQVSDGALTDTQALAVTVGNVNEAPVITNHGGGASAVAGVAENSTTVGVVLAVDPDAASTLSYSIGGGADAALFSIDATTGALAFVAAPNFEAPADAGANNVYDVIVRVSDGTLADTQAIAVTVTDVAEAPVITSGGGGTNAAVAVAENQTAVTTVSANDPDAATTLSYAITGGADAAKFSIDAATGVLRFVTAPGFDAPGDAGANNVYDLIVRVSDGALDDTQALAVTVTNVNLPPVITSHGGGASAGITLAENQIAVGTVSATDGDAGTSLVYAIVGGADAAKFSIDAATGALRFIAAPDFEAPTDADANNVCDVLVQVSDGALADTPGHRRHARQRR